MRKAAESVDSYLASVEPEARAALEHLRAVIRSAAPAATETISYQVPTFKMNKGLVAFAAFQDHCSLFLMSTTVANRFQERLRPYKLSGATIHFTPEEPLPDDLIREIVAARIEENEVPKR